MLTLIQDLFTNLVFLVPLCSWVVASLLKFVIASVMSKRPRFDRFLHGDGGMPSCHTALVISLVIMCLWCLSARSPLVALAFVFAFVTVNDALGVRRETGKQAVTIKELGDAFNAMFAEPDEQIRTEKIKVLVGHTPLQVIWGGVVGFLVALAFILIFQLPYGCMLG